MTWDKIFENDKMAVHVDNIDSVSINNKAIDSQVVVQVADEEGFQVVYSEDDVDLTTVSFGPGGETEIVTELVDPTCKCEEVEDGDPE